MRLAAIAERLFGRLVPASGKGGMDSIMQACGSAGDAGTPLKVLWLGGMPGAGKSTVARRIARRRGLRWYQSDAHTWAHRARAVRAGVPAALRFEALTPAERAACPVEERMAMALQRERGPMTVEDVRALPASPLIIAKGTQILPDMVPAGGSALWLTLSPKQQRVRLDRRHAPDPAPELYLRMGQVIAEEVARAGVPQLVVDELSLDEVVEAVERFFAPALEQGPTASSSGERRALVRYANRAEVQRYVDFFARPGSGDFGAAVSTFLCECDRIDCDAMAEMAVAAFPEPPDEESAPCLAPGHTRV